MTRFESTIENANRALYGTARRRTFFFKGLTVLLAVQMFFFGMAPTALALPAGLSSGTERITSDDGTTMTIDASSGRDFSWGSFNVANGQLVDITGVSIHNAPSFDVAGKVQSDSFLVFKTSGGNIAISGEVSAPRFFAATFSGFNHENMHFTASQVGSGDINVSGNIPGNSILVGNTVSAAGAAGTVVATTGMDGASDITIASGGGTITFTGAAGTGTLKAGTINFSDGSSASGEVTASGNITGNFTQQGGTVNADQITGTLTQSGGSATASKIAALNQTASGARATASEITGNATVAGILNGNGGLSVGLLTLTQNGASVIADGTLTIKGAATQAAGSSITAEGTALAASGQDISLNQAGNSLGAVSGTARNITLNGSSLAVNNLTASGALTLQNNASASGNVSANTISATTLTQSSGTITTKEISGTVVQNNGMIQAASAADGLKLNNAITTQRGTLDGNGGNVTVANGSTLSGTVNANTLAGNFTQNGGTINATTVAGNVTQDGNGTINATTMDGEVVQNGGTIKANNLTDGLRLSQVITTQKGELSGNGGDVSLAGGDKLSGIVSAKNLKAGTGTGNITQDAGTLTVTETLTAGTFTQTGGTASFSSSAATISQKTDNTGSITAATLSGNVTQEAENAGTINATTLSGTVTQNGGMIAGKDGGDLTLTHAITTQKGTLSAEGATLTLADGSELSGNVSAKNLTAGTGNITQKAGQINVTQTLTAGTFTQNGVAATQTSPATTATAATIAANVEQKGAGTIGAAGQNVTFNGDVKQEESGSIVGSTVTATGNITQEGGSGITADWLKLGSTESNNAQVYNLVGSGNKVDALSSFTVKSIKIDNGNDDNGNNHALTIGKAADGNRYGVSTTDGLTIAKAGAVTDDGSGVVDSKITIESAQSVTLQNSTKFEVAGISSVGNVSIDTGTSIIEPTSLTLSGAISSTQGNVGLKSDSITQNGAISGANVTLDQTDAAGTLTVGNDIEAKTGDILVRSKKAVEVGAVSLKAENGNIVVKGESATVAGTDAANTANLTAKAVGVEATAGDVTVANANFVASDGVALKASGDLDIGNNVAMGKETAADKDASLVVYADGSIGSTTLFGANRPTDKLTIAKGDITFGTTEANATEIGLTRFVYKTAQTDDAFIKFTSPDAIEIGIESAGNVNVAAPNANSVTVVSGSGSLGGSGAKVEATDVFSSTKADVNIGDSSGDDNLAGGLIASGNGKTVTLTGADSTQPPAGSVTVANGAKISANADLELTTAAGKNFTVAEGGMVESTAGSVSITSKGALDVAGTVQTKAKAISLKTEGDSAGGITLAGDVRTDNSGNSATITLSSKTGEIEQTGGMVVGYSVNAANQTIKQTGDARLEAITTDTGITASKIVQSGGGLVAAVKIAGDFEQSGNGGLLTAYSQNSITVTGKATQNAANGRIGEVTDSGTPKQTVTLGSLDQDAGTINATTLTLQANSTSGGTITADAIDATGFTLTQDGAGTITADSITASAVEQSYAGTATEHATINADTINAALTQSGKNAAASAKTAANGITITGAATQSGENATIGAEDQNVTLQGGATQNGHGKVLADTLAVTGAEIYTLSSTEGNNVATLTSKMPEADVPNPIASVTINNGDNPLTIKDIAIAADLTVDKSGNLKLGPNAEIADTATITDAGTVSFEGLKADTVNVVKSGAVTDTGDGLSALNVGTPTITLGTGGDNKVASVLLDDSAKLNLAGVQSAGDVGVKATSITQSGAISGANVTLDQTDAAGTLVVGQNITATGASSETGDILVRSANAVSVGDAGTAPNLEAANGSIVVKGVNEVTIDNANLTAKEIGVEATTEAAATKLTLKDAKFVATGTGDGMDGVVLKSGGDLKIDTGVEAGVAAAANKDAQVTIYAGEKLDMLAGNIPAKGEKMTVTAKQLGGIELTSGSHTGDNVVEFDKFAYTEHADTDTDLDFKFTGSTLSIKNDKGGVTVLTAGQDFSIEPSASSGAANVKVEARDTTATDADTKDSVEIQAAATGSTGLEARDNILVDGTADAGKIAVKGTVKSTSGTVELKSGGAIEVAAGGKVETQAADKNITLTTTGANATDITVAGATTVNGTEVAAGTVTSAGNLDMTSAKDIALAGMVSAETGKATLTAANGEVKQTAGTVSVKDLDMSAKNINQTGGAITATGDTSLEATDDSISLAATTGTGNNVTPANDFATISKAVAKNAITISDKNALTIAGAAGSADGATATTGDIDIKAVNGLTLTAAVNAGGDATLTAGTIDASAAAATIKAGDAKAVTATADNGATFGAKVQGGSVALTAKEGTLTTDEIETKAGAATLTAGTAASGNNAAKEGAIQANNTITTTGGDVIATAQGNVKLTKAVQSMDNAVTITAANNGAIDASAAAATITAADDKAVTATADNGATFGAKVQGGSVALTANGGELTTADIEAKAGNATMTATAGKLTQNGAVKVTGGNAVLTGASAEIANGASVTVNGGNARIASTAGTPTGTIDVKGMIEAQNVTVDAAGGKVTTSAAITANGGDAYVHTTAGGIEIGANVTADGHNAVFKADAGETTLGNSVVTATGVGIQGGALAEVTDANFSDVQNLALVATAGGATLTQVPASAQNVGVAVTGGDLVVETTGDTAFNGATVNAATAGAAGATVAASAATGVTAAGLTAAGTGADVTVNVTDGALAAGAITAGGDVDVTADSVNAGAVTAGGDATVTAQNGAVNAGNVTAAGAAAVTASGNITAAGITGGAGTTVTKTAAGGAINVAGNLGQGGQTTVNANGADVTAGTLASGGLLDVNNAGAVAANIAAGGDAQIQSGSLVAGNTAAGGNLTLEVGGAADVGQLAVGGDVNGVVGGQVQTTGGQVGSIGQAGGALQANGGFIQNGVLNSGPVMLQAANYQMNGNLNAGGSAVNIIAAGGIQGNGILTGGALTLLGGAIGAAANPLQVVSANLQQITGNGVWLVNTAAGTIAINVINSTGDVGLNIPNAQVAGGGSITAGGDIDLTVNQQFGTLANPVTVSFGGTLTVNGTGVPLLHIVIDGTATPGDINIIYNANGFAIWGNAQKGYQIVGLGADKQRVLNRALTFTVNTPELKSSQGIFGSPSFIHTKMSVSEARSMGNMDILAINNTDFRNTWRQVRENADVFAVDWTPPVRVSGNGPLANKIRSVKSEAEQQPELLPFPRKAQGK